jgi:hypothetical protein
MRGNSLKLFVKLFVFLALFVFMTAVPGKAIEKIKPDARGTALVNSLLEALLLDDRDVRIARLLPLVHMSLLSKDRRDLTWDIKEFSFKKASANAKFYKFPVEIFEVHKGNEVTIGFKETAERGRFTKYFVQKKSQQMGRPAPITLFWPLDGGAPKVVDFGSL